MVIRHKVKVFQFMIGKIILFGITINVQLVMKLALLVKVKEHLLMVYKILGFREMIKIVHLVLKYLTSLKKKNQSVTLLVVQDIIKIYINNGLKTPFLI